MFNDQQDNQAQANTDIDQVAQDIADTSSSSTVTPSIGLGTNPSTFSPVLPQAATSTPLPPSDNVVADDTTTTSPEPEVIKPTSAAAPSDLDDIKSQALQQLSPLVGKLEQPPEERYKTLMMLIQASDNHELIKEAYAAANAITDETLKAEALLGVVNEINYFTQKANS